MSDAARAQRFLEGGGLRGGEERRQVVDEHHPILELGHAGDVGRARPERLGGLDGVLVDESELGRTIDTQDDAARTRRGDDEVVGRVERPGGQAEAARTSSTGRTRPLTLTTPSMTAGALGRGVIATARTSSSTSTMGRPYRCPATSKTRTSRVRARGASGQGTGLARVRQRRHR